MSPWPPTVTWLLSKNILVTVTPESPKNRASRGFLVEIRDPNAADGCRQCGKPGFQFSNFFARNFYFWCRRGLQTWTEARWEFSSATPSPTMTCWVAARHRSGAAGGGTARGPRGSRGPERAPLPGRGCRASSCSHRGGCLHTHGLPMRQRRGGARSRPGAQRCHRSPIGRRNTGMVRVEGADAFHTSEPRARARGASAWHRRRPQVRSM